MNIKSVLLLALISFGLGAQKNPKNLIFITLDGMRWQEVFMGLDSSLAADANFNQGQSEKLFSEFYANDKSIARQKLLPNFWRIFSENGQIYGNRNLGNNSQVSNPYKISYPGYSEIFCGKVDTNIKTNAFIPNPNTNFLEILNKQDAYKNKVAIFGAWAAFYSIFNIEKNKIPISNAFKFGIQNLTENEKLIQNMTQNSFRPFGENECLDVFTHFQAMEYLKTRKPRALFIGYGETDEWAHAGKYAYYLKAAQQTDKWIAEIWNYIQSDKEYKNNTILFITTDHGRGIGNLWTDHNKQTPNSEQTWFAIIAPDIQAKGEIKTPQIIYHKQIAKTLCNHLGVNFESETQIIPLKP